MRTRTMAAAGLLSALGLLFSSGVAAHPEGESDGGGAHGGGSDGHVAANVNYGFEVVGHSALSGVQDGRYTDVWAHDGYAYVGSFQDPDCSRAGVYVADLADPTSPEYVGMIKSPPDTRVNDVKVTDVGDRDVLIFSLEKCGDSVGANLNQKGQGGISLWDVTDPANPHALKQQFLDFQVHNTYPWTTEDGSTYALVVDDENVDDVHVVDLTKPQSPKHIATTGIGTWLAEGLFDAQTSELFLGSFATPLLHDVWVELNPSTGRWEGVLSYWDAGFITIDLTDPSNPTYIADSDYPDEDPVLSEYRDRPEGNAHAAVFGGDDNEFIFAGDEDFDVFQTIVQVGDAQFSATQGSDVPQIAAGESIEGPAVYVGRACSSLDQNLSAGSTGATIAVVERGDCAFTDKAVAAEAAGYAAVLIFNQPTSERADGNGCEGSVSMLVEAGIPALFAPRSAGYAALGLPYAPADCEDAASQALLVPGTASQGDIALASAFDGWGYFWAINNSGGDVQVSGPAPMVDMQPSPDITVGPMGTMGYYAPEEVSDPALATGAGDLTMHNLETDLLERERSFISWYALGMRAVEWREGHYHDSDVDGQSVDSWNVHEVGRWIAPLPDDADNADDVAKLAEFAEAAGVAPDRLSGSNFWGVTQFVGDDGTRYVLGSDRNTGLWVFEWNCEDVTSTLYCNAPVQP